jgi:hypothetical protein
MNNLRSERLEAEHIILWELRAWIAQQVVETLMNDQERIYWIDSTQWTKRNCSNCSNLIDAHDWIPCLDCRAIHPNTLGEWGTWHEFCATRWEASQQSEKLKYHRSISINGAQIYRDLCFYADKRVRQISWLTYSQVQLLLGLQNRVYKERDEWFLNQENEIGVMLSLRMLSDRFFANK